MRLVYILAVREFQGTLVGDKWHEACSLYSRCGGCYDANRHPASKQHIPDGSG